MASAAAPEMRSAAAALSALIREISAMDGADFPAGQLGADCIGLVRKVSFLSHLLQEIEDIAASSGAGGDVAEASSSLPAEDPAACLGELRRAIGAAKRFLLLARTPPPQPTDNASLDVVCKNTSVQFKYVMWQLEMVLGGLPCDHFRISAEVHELVELVRSQLRREIEKIEDPDVNIFTEIHNIVSGYSKDVDQQSASELETLQGENMDDDHRGLYKIVALVAEINGVSESDAGKITCELIERLEKAHAEIADNKASNGSKGTSEKIKRCDSLAIPEDFSCPISLELMRDPVFVSTGQTYERVFIQRWIDCGNRTCPKTRQKLDNLTLTPNYVLRNLITQWCKEHGIEQPKCKTDGSFNEVPGDRATIDVLVRNLSSISLDERKSAAAEIRSLAKRSTENRILLAEAGAIPALVNLLSAKESKTQEHAVTSLLNLSIYDQNKELIVHAGAVLSIVQVLRTGSMEARENAAAAIFSLSLVDENRIIIGSTPGAIDALVELLQSGSLRGRKDAATALFNLCICHVNKVRAVRAGILVPLIQMLQDPSSNGMIDEALTILSVLVSHRECKAAIAKANTIPVLIDLLRSGQPRNKENAAAILLALCKKDAENMACLGRLGALIPLTELTKTGTDRAKRKATSLLEHLNKLQVL